MDCNTVMYKGVRLSAKFCHLTISIGWLVEMVYVAFYNGSNQNKNWHFGWPYEDCSFIASTGGKGDNSVYIDCVQEMEPGLCAVDTK